MDTRLVSQKYCCCSLCSCSTPEPNIKNCSSVHLDVWMDGWTDGRTDGLTDWLTDIWSDGWWERHHPGNPERSKRKGGMESHGERVDGRWWKKNHNPYVVKFAGWSHFVFYWEVIVRLQGTQCSWVILSTATTSTSTGNGLMWDHHLWNSHLNRHLRQLIIWPINQSINQSIDRSLEITIIEVLKILNNSFNQRVNHMSGCWRWQPEPSVVAGYFCVALERERERERETKRERERERESDLCLQGTNTIWFCGSRRSEKIIGGRSILEQRGGSFKLRSRKWNHRRITSSTNFQR